MNQFNFILFLEKFFRGVSFYKSELITIFLSFKLDSTSSHNGQKFVDEKPYGINLPDETFHISQTEREKLYCELLYTIKHKIGCTVDGHSSFMNDLYRYAQLAFNISNEDHDRLFALVSGTKPPIVVLNVEVMEAKGLDAKDANG
jgi:hypothetical protein